MRLPVESSLPLINVVFLLLLFFLTSGTVVYQPGRSIEPPTSLVLGSSTAPAEAIYVDADGTVSFAGKEQSLTDIARTIRAGGDTERRGALSKPVQLVADRDLKAKALLAIIAELKDLGLQSLTIMTVKDEGS